MATLSYPLDFTGTKPENLVSELQALTEVNAAPYRILIPKFAPFYLDNFKLTYIDINQKEQLLIEDVDYTLCLPFIGGTRSTGKIMYGAATIHDSTLNGTVRVEYQTVGGPWTGDRQYILTALTETVYNPRRTVWDAVTDVQQIFPPAPHDHHLDFIYGHGDLIAAINNVSTNILKGPNTTSTTVKHILEIGNPHKTTPKDLGLLPLATDAQADSGQDLDVMISLKQLNKILSKYQLK